MRKSSNDTQMNVAGIRRNIKNIAHNYSDAQRKVREATSNDPWGPSSTIMAEIADLTYNVVAFSEIMQMIWKRLNDHGKNWRHVNKALILLDYLIKTGSEKVGQQCKENFYAIQTLKDFQHLEEGQDYGQTVRENAKHLIILLKDDEKLKNERARAIKAKQRFAQTVSGFGSDTAIESATSPKYPAFRGDWANKESNLPRDIEIARPQTAGEEELQLQLALAMSREEAEQEEQKRKSDDVRLQLALSQSQQDFKKSQEKMQQTHLVDLLDESLDDDTPIDPWSIVQPPPPHTISPWHPSSAKPASTNADPWQPAAGGARGGGGGGAAAASATGIPTAPVKTDPWGLPTTNSPTTNLSPVNTVGPTVSKNDPWSPDSQNSSPDLDDFVVISNRNRPTTPKTNGNGITTSANNDPFELNLLGDALSTTATGSNATSASTVKKTPQSFLGENSALVNLDNLVTASKPNNPTAANPFSDPGIPQQSPRPIFHTQPPKPSINEIKQQNFAQFSSNPANSSAVDSFGGTSYGSGNNRIRNQAPTQDPWAPANTLNGNGNNVWMKSNEPANPFLS